MHSNAVISSEGVNFLDRTFSSLVKYLAFALNPDPKLSPPLLYNRETLYKWIIQAARFPNSQSLDKVISVFESPRAPPIIEAFENLKVYTNEVPRKVSHLVCPSIDSIPVSEIRLCVPTSEEKVIWPSSVGFDLPKQNDMGGVIGRISQGIQRLTKKLETSTSQLQYGKLGQAYHVLAHFNDPDKPDWAKSACVPLVAAITFQSRKSKTSKADVCAGIVECSVVLWVDDREKPSKLFGIRPLAKRLKSTYTMVKSDHEEVFNLLSTNRLCFFKSLHTSRVGFFHFPSEQRSDLEKIIPKLLEAPRLSKMEDPAAFLGDETVWTLQDQSEILHFSYNAKFPTDLAIKVLSLNLTLDTSLQRYWDLERIASIIRSDPKTRFRRLNKNHVIKSVFVDLILRPGNEGMGDFSR